MTVKIAVIGLGYVGLPLARLFATKFPVIGFDINTNRVAELNSGTDNTLEVDDHALRQVLVSKRSRRSLLRQFLVLRALVLALQPF